MTNAPTPAELSKGKSDNTNKATKKFDYTAIADRLRTVSWSNYGHPSSFSMNIVKNSKLTLKPVDTGNIVRHFAIGFPAVQKL